MPNLSKLPFGVELALVALVVVVVAAGVVVAAEHAGVPNWDDTIIRQSEPDIPNDAPGEGLYIYIQSTTCRAAVQATIFGNMDLRRDPAKCCDLCNKQLFDRTRPSKPVPAARQQTAKKGVPVDSVRQSLHSWRRNIRKEHNPRALFGPQAILDDDTCKSLAALGSIHSRDQLSQHLSGWARWDKLGTSLFHFMTGLDIPPLVSRGRKRPATAEPEAANKRAHTVQALVPTLEQPLPALPQRHTPHHSVASQSLPVHPPIPRPSHASTSTSRPANSQMAPGVTSSQTPSHSYSGYYPAYYSPYHWQASQMTHPYDGYAQYPTTLQPISTSGALAGNPYAAMVIVARAPSNSAPQPRGPVPAGSATQQGYAPPSD
ncbi:hypothetical protein B0H10DRAFT_2238992 [Mycena sp. CBHHK59/15]|nr:hypothetical protein B0H10DRAFT_2238992 [Mycena sp. CBHHK59/15]